MKLVNAILYSVYKHSSTIKWLVGCDPIGTTWNGSISDGYPGVLEQSVILSKRQLHRYSTKYCLDLP